MAKTAVSPLKTLVDSIKEVHTSVNAFVNQSKQAQEQLDNRLKRIEDMSREKILDRVDKNTGMIRKDRWSFARFCYAVATKDWTYAPFEKAEVDKHRQKVMQASTFGAGGSVIPPQYVAELIELLRPALITEALGVRTMTGLTGSPVMIPKLSSGATANWIAPEGTTITASDLGTGQLNLQPKKIAALVKMSNDLALLSNPAMEQTIRQDIVRQLADGIETAFFAGTGANGQPLGLINWTPAISDTVFPDNADDSININAMKDMLLSMENANALRGSPKWAMNPTAWYTIDKWVDGNKRHYLTPDPGDPTRGQLFGYQVLKSTLVSATGGGANTDVAYFGNWDDAILAIWSTVEVAASTEAATAFESDELWIRAISRVDVGFRHIESFEMMDDINE